MRLLLSIATLMVIICCQQKVTINYPEPLPGDSIIPFLTGIVSKPGDTLDFNACFSPDGKSFYFSRTQHGTWDILVTHFNGTSWSREESLPFNTDTYADADPMFGPDGNLYFISNLPKNSNDTLPDFDIWFSTPLNDGSWTKPENVSEVNSDSTEYYVSFGSDGSMYFASSRPGGYGQEDIYISRRINGKYATPVNLGPQINSKNSEHDPALPSNDSFIVYTSVDREGGVGEGDLYYSIKQQDSSWTKGENFRQLNTTSYEYCSYFSPDQKYFFYSSQYNVMWTSTTAFPKQLQDLLNR